MKILKIPNRENSWRSERFVRICENPLKNLKYLYATGDIKLDGNNKVVRVGGIEKTIKDGIIYDSKLLLQDVKKIVDDEKYKTPGWEKLLYESIERK